MSSTVITMAGTELSVHELKPQVHLDKIFLFSKNCRCMELSTGCIFTLQQC